MKHIFQLFLRLFSVLLFKSVWKVSVRTLTVIAACLLIAPFYEASAWAQFENLLNRIPASANSIVVIDVSGVHSSALATKEGWQKNMKPPM